MRLFGKARPMAGHHDIQVRLLRIQGGLAEEGEETKMAPEWEPKKTPAWSC